MPLNEESLCGDIPDVKHWDPKTGAGQCQGRVRPYYPDLAAPMTAEPEPAGKVIAKMACEECGAEDEEFTSTKYVEDRLYLEAMSWETEAAEARYGFQVCRKCDGRIRFYRLVDGAWKRERYMREPIVKIFKSTGKNAEYAITTTAKDREEFIREFTLELNVLIEQSRSEGTVGAVDEQLQDQMYLIASKLDGYKAEGVFERRVLIVGEPNPEAHMRCLNAHEPQPA
jgi:hypothetical protein